LIEKVPVSLLEGVFCICEKCNEAHFCETVSLLCDSLTFLRQCGQGLIQQTTSWARR